LESERFRFAPRYDFNAPPHQGKLYYENCDWGVTGETWRNLAEKACLRLGAEYEFAFKEIKSGKPFL
jgi:hypothetical protein